MHSKQLLPLPLWLAFDGCGVKQDNLLYCRLRLVQSRSDLPEGVCVCVAYLSLSAEPNKCLWEKCAKQVRCKFSIERRCFKLIYHSGQISVTLEGFVDCLAEEKANSLNLVFNKFVLSFFI